MIWIQKPTYASCSAHPVPNKQIHIDMEHPWKSISYGSFHGGFTIGLPYQCWLIYWSLPNEEIHSWMMGETPTPQWKTFMEAMAHWWYALCSDGDVPQSVDNYPELQCCRSTICSSPWSFMKKHRKIGKLPLFIPVQLPDSIPGLPTLCLGCGQLDPGSTVRVAGANLMRDTIHWSDDMMIW
jgi:hypothetical protein